MHPHRESTEEPSEDLVPSSVFPMTLLSPALSAVLGKLPDGRREGESMSHLSLLVQPGVGVVLRFWNECGVVGCRFRLFFITPKGQG